MKKIFITTIAILGLSTAQAQVAIGQANVSSSSVSLEFATSENKGMLLPWVDSESAVTGVANGTLVYDTSTGNKKVKVKLASGWQDLSINEGTTINPNTNVDGLSIQTPLTENPNGKVSIGTPTNTPGILVLEDTDKAMVLPKVTAPDQNIINPAPGMMVYDPTSQELAVFNGTVWTYWKAN